MPKIMIEVSNTPHGVKVDVQGDLDGNGTVDFEIQIAGVQTLNNLDFLL